MKSPLVSIVRFETKDGLELQGHLYKPARASKKILIHIHGLIGNFYENLFVEEIAHEITKKGWSLLAFNNRGAGIVTDFIKNRASSCEYARIGGSLERFYDSASDIDAAVNFAIQKGYHSIVLQGHSLGCQKSAFYFAKTRKKIIRGLIFLAPVDDVACAKMFLGKDYKTAVALAKNLVRSKKQTRLPKHMEFYPMMTPARFLDIASPNTVAGALMDYNGPLRLLRSLRIPVLAVFCKKDQYQPDSPHALAVLKAIVHQCDTKLIPNGGHLFPKKEKFLAKTVATWLKGMAIK